MIAHDLRLALRSIKRTAGLSTLMIAALATGIAAAVITMTLWHTKSGNPLWWKNDALRVVLVDSRLESSAADAQLRHPEYPPFLMSYRDAKSIYQSPIPTRTVMMAASRRLLVPLDQRVRPQRVAVRLTTTDFFEMFDVPFQYGAVWARQDDETPANVVVLSKAANDRIFRGENSIGRSVNLGGFAHRVVGVLRDWVPQPRVYDLRAPFAPPEDVFIPFGWAEAAQLEITGGGYCEASGSIVNSFQELTGADCTWVQFWAEFESQGQREQYQEFIDNFAREQKELGRYPRPLNNRLVDVSTWLQMNDVVGDESRALVLLAIFFLVVCLLNTIGLMLAKFLRAASSVGIRRALGATRGDIVRQHLTEVVVLGLVGGVLGLLIAELGLWLIRELLYLPIAYAARSEQSAAIARSLTHLDLTMVATALVLALVASVLAGIYPAWRIGRISPSQFLKTR